jgi:O-antigen ligase
MIGKDPTLTDRTLVWDLLLSLHTNPLHGMGFENFWLGPRLDAMWRAYRWGPTQAHNGYLEVFLNLGWIGVALLTLRLITGYQTVMTGLRRSTPTSRLMLAYFVVGIVFNFTEAAFFRISSPVWFIFLLTITKAPDLQRDQAQAPLRRYTSERIAPVSLGAVTRAAGTRSRFSSNA